MTEQKLPNNCLLKKTKELIELKLLKETLKNSDKCIFNVSMREVGKMLEKLKSYEWKRVKFV